MVASTRSWRLSVDARTRHFLLQRHYSLQVLFAEMPGVSSMCKERCERRGQPSQANQHCNMGEVLQGNGKLSHQQMSSTLFNGLVLPVKPAAFYMLPPFASPSTFTRRCEICEGRSLREPGQPSRNLRSWPVPTSSNPGPDVTRCEVMGSME